MSKTVWKEVTVSSGRAPEQPRVFFEVPEEIVQRVRATGKPEDTFVDCLERVLPPRDLTGREAAPATLIPDETHDGGTVVERDVIPPDRPCCGGWGRGRRCLDCPDPGASPWRKYPIR